MAIGKAEDEYEHVEVEGVMDSGAFDTICSKELIGGNEIRETKASKAGMNYWAANGTSIKNKGEADLKGEGPDGMPIEFTAQIGEGVKKLLISIRRAVAGGNMVIFGSNMKAIRDLAKLDKVQENVIVGVKSGKRSEIKDKHGMYVYPMTIKRKKKKEDDRMDIGFANKTAFEELPRSENEEDDKEDAIDEWTPF